MYKILNINSGYLDVQDGRKCVLLVLIVVDINMSFSNVQAFVMNCAIKKRTMIIPNAIILNSACIADTGTAGQSKITS